jgi:hypothetical protein
LFIWLSFCLSITNDVFEYLAITGIQIIVVIHTTGGFCMLMVTGAEFAQGLLQSELMSYPHKGQVCLCQWVSVEFLPERWLLLRAKPIAPSSGSQSTDWVPQEGKLLAWCGI